MRNIPTRYLTICFCFALTLTVATQPLGAQTSPWKFSASGSVKETYDSNVYLQDVTPKADQGSMVTNVAVNLGLTYAQKGDWDTTLSLGVTPQYTWYHSEPGEDHATYTGTANLVTKTRNWALEMSNAVTQIDGDDEGLIFTGPGGAPAVGGIPIRDRRDATIFRSTYRLTYTEGPWLIRPIFTSYVHDFQTKHRSTPGYLNYVDRNDFGGGVDVGYRIFRDVYLLAGYRYGHQHQPELLNSSIEYSNQYHRVLLGVEGKPTDWMKVSVLMGPDFRDYGPHVAPTFDYADEGMKFWCDASITLTPTPQDEISLLIRRYEQPSYGGRAIYEDTTYQLAYRRKISDSIQAQCMLQAYAGEWVAPVMRDDWIYTVNLALVFKFNANLNGELGWSLDRAESKLPDTAGREFTRHLIWASVKWAF